MNIDNENEQYWEKRCEFWCSNYLELAQAVKLLLIVASRVDDYGELQHEVRNVKQLLVKDSGLK